MGRLSKATVAAGAVALVTLAGATSAWGSERKLASGRVVWTTAWRLCWDPVEGARDYVVRVVTAEGGDPRPRSTSRTCYQLDVAKGIGARPGARPTRREQLSLMRATMSLNVAPRFPSGSIGRASPEVPVGQAVGGE